MAFLDELGQKVSTVGQNAKQKAKCISETARIREGIAAQEKQLYQFYYEVGKIYVGHHYRNYEDHFSELIPSIIEAETKLRDLRNQLNALEKEGKCEYCGAVVAKNAKFCMSCGKEVQKVQDNASRCPVCGAAISAELAFCTSCGTKIQ